MPRICKFCIGRLSAFLCCSSLDVVVAVTSDYDRHIGIINDSHFSFGQFVSFTGIGCSCGINMIKCIAFGKHDVVGLMGVFRRILPEGCVNRFFRDKANLTINYFCHDIGNAIQLVAIGTRNLCALVEDDILCTRAQCKLQRTAIVKNRVFRVTVFILRHKLQFLGKCSVCIKLSIVFINDDGVRLTFHRVMIHLAGGIVLHGQGRVCRLKNGVFHVHCIAAHGNNAELIAGMQCILFQPVDTDEILFLPVGPGTFRQFKAVTLVCGKNHGGSILIVQTFAVFVVGINLGGYAFFDIDAENTRAQCIVEKCFILGQRSGCSAGCVAHRFGNFNERNAIAAAVELQHRISGFVDTDYCRIAGTRKILKLEVHLRCLSCQMDMMGRLLRLRACVGAIYRQESAVFMSSAGQIFEVILISGNVRSSYRRTQGIQFHRICGCIVGQNVVNLTFCVID